MVPAQQGIFVQLEAHQQLSLHAALANIALPEVEVRQIALLGIMELQRLIQ